MAKQEVVYTDGHDIVVTPSELKVKHTKYKLLGILRHGMVVTRPMRLAGILIALLGIAFTLFGIVCFLTPLNADVLINGAPFSLGQLFIYGGSFIGLVGIFFAVISTNRYTVRIETAEGSVNAVTSRRREYIQQILNGLNRAFRVANLRRSTLSRTTYL